MALDRSLVVALIAIIGAQAAVLAGGVAAVRGQGVQPSEGRAPVISVEARERVRAAVAGVGLIFVRQSRDAGSGPPWRRGSAVVVRRNGVVVTNWHVIADEDSGRLFDEIFLELARPSGAAGAQRYRLKPSLINKEYDLALLQIVAGPNDRPLDPSAAFPAVELGDSAKVNELDDLFVIGFPEQGGSTVTISAGLVEGKDPIEQWIKTTARLIHGNSGGAAVNEEGRLIGVPTRVLIDRRPVDRDGDGFPDLTQEYGAVGFLRPAHLIAGMLEQLADSGRDTAPAAAGAKSPASDPPFVVTPELMPVRGLVRAARDKKGVAGARAGLLPVGNTEVTAENLLSWGSTRADGTFELNRPVPAGRYLLKVKAIGYQPVTQQVEVNEDGPFLVIDLRP